MQLPGCAVPLDDIFLPDELARRVPARPDHLREKLAVYDLAALMADHPDALLPRFVDIALELTGGVSAGLSLFERDPKPGVFRWHHVRGSLAAFEGVTTPRGHSPCGVTLDRGAPILAVHAERYYDWIAAASIEVPEVLLVPLRADPATLLGTLWIVADKVGHFDSGHARAMTELASFITVGLRIRDVEMKLQRAVAEQQTLLHEMSHRLKNVIAIADGMVWMTAMGAETPEAMATALSGRFQALSRATALVRRNPGTHPLPAMPELSEVLRMVLEPHDAAWPGGPSRISLSGPAILCDERAVSGIALVFNELATNAVKYGALSVPHGRVDITWSAMPDAVELSWVESGGPRIDGPPASESFGTTLMTQTVQSQFDGTFRREWRESGLAVSLTLARAMLSDEADEAA
ncbi:GAF domain-containing protein [Roseomonas terrae]|uniref:histidine kinase n=1 Tax=Neoroseomonas terrae TaxID=424799 RepID=A0ABS5EQ88_9PROT|nr:HWE histidine kinase domain-containing protein [Neoroseomonas terrae]MBR0653205.1 GAF domain-containing protein [Neoroseomonas terrae]